MPPKINNTSPTFRKALTPFREALYEELVGNADCGPFDGCCLLVARALQKVIGGELVVLVRAGQIAPDSAAGHADHAAVRLNGKLYDFDGPLAPAAFMARFGKKEGVNIGSVRPFREGDLPGAVRDEVLQGRVEAILREALGQVASVHSGVLVDEAIADLDEALEQPTCMELVPR